MIKLIQQCMKEKEMEKMEFPSLIKDNLNLIFLE